MGRKKPRLLAAEVRKEEFSLFFLRIFALEDLKSFNEKYKDRRDLLLDRNLEKNPSRGSCLKDPQSSGQFPKKSRMILACLILASVAAGLPTGQLAKHQANANMCECCKRAGGDCRA